MDSKESVNADEEAILLEDLSIDIFQTLNKYLTLKDIIALCLSSKTIYDKYKSGRLVEMKALSIVKKEAPLYNTRYANTSKIIDHALLLERDFHTTYYIYPRLFAGEVSTDENNLLKPCLLECRFGYFTDGCMFNIKGLPPPRGTIVHITVDIEQYLAGDEIDSYIHIHLTLDDMRKNLEVEPVDHTGYESFARRVLNQIAMKRIRLTGGMFNHPEDLDNKTIMDEVAKEWKRGEHEEVCRYAIEKLIRKGISRKYRYQYFQVRLP